MRAPAIVIAALIAGTTIIASPAMAQDNTPDKNTPGDSGRLLDEVRRMVAQGRTQLDDSQRGSVDTLRAAAQKALANLVAFVGPQILKASAEEIPTNGIYGAAARQTADAHFWWGYAAEQFGQRDEATTAYARAIRFAGVAREGNSTAQDARYRIGGTLSDGLPLLVPDDTLEIVAKIHQADMWRPRRFSVDFSNLNLYAQTPPDDGSPKDKWKHNFLVTSGRLFPPVLRDVEPELSMVRIPPLYRLVNPNALPGVLKLDSMIVGYEQIESGANKGLWRQVVNVFYASRNRTKDNREDRARAEALCAQFLKVRALMSVGLGLQNNFVKNGVTTLWLSEVSSWWPRDDDDLRVRESVGASMPKVNVHVEGTPEPNEIDTSPVSWPWRAAAQMDSAPGDITFFKIGTARDEGEWLRQLLHEYGHVVLPAFNSFKPPLEPYANGLLGETLGMLWAAGDPSIWGLPPELNLASTNGENLPAEVREHVRNRALAPLKFWRSKGVVSPLRRDTGVEGVRYLQGFTVYAERVYGAAAVGRIFVPLAEKGINAPNPLERMKALNAESFYSQFPAAMNDALGTTVRGAEIRVVVGGEPNKTLPIWLGGALELNDQTENELISRAPVRLKAGQKVSGWLFVPTPAQRLRIEWQAATRGADLVQVEGLRGTAVEAQHPDASGASALDVKGRSGWQRLTFTAKTDVTILNSQFEK